MIFLKKISTTVVSFLIIVYLLFTFTGCTSKPAEEVIEKTTEEVVTKEEKETTIEEEVIVMEKNTAPKALISPNELNAGINQEISISGKKSSDPEKEKLTYEWTLPDGSVSTEPIITLSFEEFGEYEISLTVYDGELSDTAKKIILIENQPPVAKANEENIDCEVGEVIFLTAEDSYDPDGDELTYTWELPDGTIKEQMEIEYKVEEPGKQKIILRVSDGELESLLPYAISLDISETPEYFKASCINVTYDELLRYPEKYEDVRIHVKGKIMQKGSGWVLILITKGSYSIWDDITFLILPDDSPSIIEDDIIEIWGYGADTFSYETVMGAEKTVPKMIAKHVELLVKAGSR